MEFLETRCGTGADPTRQPLCIFMWLSH